MLSGNTYFQCISMIFRPFTLFLLTKSSFLMVEVSLIHHTLAITCNEVMWCHTTRIELFYFDDNFRCIAQWGLVTHVEVSKVKYIQCGPHSAWTQRGRAEMRAKVCIYKFGRVSPNFT